jgi:hypothetical protein
MGWGRPNAVKSVGENATCGKKNIGCVGRVNHFGSMATYFTAAGLGTLSSCFSFTKTQREIPCVANICAATRISFTEGERENLLTSLINSSHRFMCFGSVIWMP